MLPLVLNSPDPMVKVKIVTTKDRSTQTLKTLHAAGVLHVEESHELKPVDKEAIEQERRTVAELLASINEVLSYAPQEEQVALTEDVEVMYTRPLEEIDSDVRALCTRLSNMHQTAAKLRENLKELAELTRYLGSLGQEAGIADINLKDLGFSGDYLFSQVFVFSRDSYESFRTKFPRLIRKFPYQNQNLSP